VYRNTFTLITKVSEVILQSFDEAPESNCLAAYFENKICFLRFKTAAKGTCL